MKQPAPRKNKNSKRMKKEPFLQENSISQNYQSTSSERKIFNKKGQKLFISQKLSKKKSNRGDAHNKIIENLNEEQEK